MTDDLIEYFRLRGFRGKILAYSSDLQINKILVLAGCTGIIESKAKGPAAVLRELGIH